MKKRAFTLVELLVTIAVLAVMVGLLLPVLSRAKAASSRAISVNSLSQLAAGGRLYLNENNNTFWPYQQITTNGMQWWYGLETFASMGQAEGTRTVDYSQGPLGPYMMTAGGVKTDPAFLTYSPRLKPKYSNGNYGYGYNTLLATDSKGKPRNATQIDKPSQLVVFATCAQVNAFQAPASAKNPMIEEFYMVNDTQVTVHFRHGGNALAAFLDGSVRPLSMAADMLPGSKDARIPTANIGTLQPQYLKQDGW